MGVPFYYGNDFEYTQRRLKNTVVNTTDGIAVHIFNFNFEDRKAICNNLANGEIMEVPLEKIDMEPPTLGYFNYDGKAYLASRQPIRNDWRQGISVKNLRIKGVERPDRFSFSVLNQCITDTYPTWERAVQMLERNRSVAFSREFAVSRAKSDSITLLYREEVVGHLKDGVLVLHPKYFYLSELLQKRIRS